MVINLFNLLFQELFHPKRSLHQEDKCYVPSPSNPSLLSPPSPLPPHQCEDLQPIRTVFPSALRWRLSTAHLVVT